MFLKRRNLYGRSVDNFNIVEVPEKWLYKVPDFLDYEVPESDALSIIQNTQLLLGNNAGDPGETFADMKKVKSCPSRYTFVEDVKKSRKQHKPYEKSNTSKSQARSFKQLWDCLLKWRPANEAKNRFIQLQSTDAVRAMMCCVASPESERTNLAQFFDRQGTPKAYLYDEMEAAQNSWITEVTFIGFRIIGDFFDRYWTCHYVDGNFDEDQDIDKKRDDDESGNVHKDIRPIYAGFPNWQQRKVLEIILITRILETVCQNTKEILAEVKTTSSQSQNTMFEDKYGRLEERSLKNLLGSERVLLILKGNLASLREVIDQWSVRESTQGRERPRWTRRDDQKYGKTIKQRLALFESQVRDVRTKEIDIEFLLGRVASAQEAIRSQKSLMEARNITLFTYVTVFFLPAGLAVSIFSMADVPSGRVVGWMILTAVVALLITVTVLYGVIHKFRRDMWKGRPGETRDPKNQEVSKSREAPNSPDDNFPKRSSGRRSLRSMLRFSTGGDSSRSTDTRGQTTSNMNIDTKPPQPPPQTYAPLPPSSSSSTPTPTHEVDIEAQHKYTPEKNPLKTWSQVAQEWKYGSKSRVVTHFCLYFLIGFIIGGIVGIVIGVCVAYA
ncbi:uncharacterized protein BDV14DRAFT_203449 [Aspergillus stella-maris]|uniref:uncharacterized protein n=1 Tax=Aspergillus stella-maris TaxID=1810926 RepID=UPI003CCDA94C